MVQGRDGGELGKKLASALAWELEYGSKVEWLIEIRKLGQKVEALDKRPVVYEDLQSIWAAFEILSHSRQNGFGVGSIPLSEMRAYIEIFNIEDTGHFISCIRAMDQVYVDHWNKKLSEPDGSKS